MDRITTMHSTFFEGKKFDKHTLGNSYVASTKLLDFITEEFQYLKDLKQ